MVYAIIGLSLIFVAIGFMVTEKNARYILAGYNTMSTEERSKFDLKSYIPNFRKFHIFLGVSFLLLGLVFNSLNQDVGRIFIMVYPIAAYIYFIATSSKYTIGNNPKYYRTAIFILFGTLVFVIGLLLWGSKENKLTFDSTKIEIEGTYGETLLSSEIRSIELIHELPEITLRTNGFSHGDVNKGFFKTESGEIVKLILNADNKPYILFTKTDGKKIYYAAKKESNEKLWNDMKSKLPDRLFKQ
jgi:uncharacterized protein DUF3784